MESLTSNGNAFQSLGAAHVNDLSPSVTLDVDVDSGTRDFRLDSSRLFYLCKVSSVARGVGGGVGLVLSEVHQSNSSMFEAKLQFGTN